MVLGCLVPFKLRRWTTLLGGFLIHFSLGSYYTLGNINPYIISYVRHADGSDVRYSHAIWLNTALGISMSLSNIVSGVCISVFNLNMRVSILIGVILMSSANALTYFSIQANYPLTILTLGVMNGIGTGFAYMSPLSIAMKSKGLANSIILFGFGGGSIIFDQIQTIFINPDNYSPDHPYSEQFPDEKYFSQPDLLERIPRCFLLQSAIYITMQLIGLVLLFEKTAGESGGGGGAENKINDDIKLDDDEIDDVESSVLKDHWQLSTGKLNSLGVNNENPEDGMGIRQLIKTRAFICLASNMALATIPPALIIAYYKTFGETFITDDEFLAVIGSMAAMCNAFGRIGWGFMIDRLPYKLCFLIANSIVIALISTVYLTKYIGNKEVYMAWICAIYLIQSHIYVTTPTTAARCFGQKNFTAYYSIIFMSTIPGSFVCAFLGSQSDTFGWFYLFLIACCLSLITWISALLFNVKKSNGKDI